MPTDLESVLSPLDCARGLPNRHYIDESLFVQEQQALLCDNWAGIGFAADIPNPGDVKPVTFLGIPLLLVHDRQGDIHVYQNTCRHRGMILVQEAKKVHRVIRCPYHSWCYGLDGKLEATPHVGGPGVNCHPAINPEELGLFRFPSRLWLGVIFVNISARAEPFDTVTATLRERWQDFDQPVYGNADDSRFQMTVNANWKLAVENFCESYHLPWIHPGLNSYSRLQDHYPIEQPHRYSGQGTLVYRQLQGQDQQALADFQGLARQWDTGAEYIALYPNVLLGVHRDHTFAMILEPVRTDCTIEHVALCYTQAVATGASWQPLRRENASLWQGVFNEDVGVVEGMQAGRHGPRFDGGRFSPAMDGPTHGFHQWVAGRWQQYTVGEA